MPDQPPLSERKPDAILGPPAFFQPTRSGTSLERVYALGRTARAKVGALLAVRDDHPHFGVEGSHYGKLTLSFHSNGQVFATPAVGNEGYGLLDPETRRSRYDWYAMQVVDGQWAPVAPSSLWDHPDLVKFGYLKSDDQMAQDGPNVLDPAEDYKRRLQAAGLSSDPRENVRMLHQRGTLTDEERDRHLQNIAEIRTVFPDDDTSPALIQNPRDGESGMPMPGTLHPLTSGSRPAPQPNPPAAPTPAPADRPPASQAPDPKAP